MDTTQITHVSLCAGYGGIDLGLKRAIPTLRTIAFSEIEAFACANLVAKMEAGLLDPAPIWTDLKTFPWEQFRGLVDVLSGGYPCQPFSSAGKRLGANDPRHLWPHISRAIRVVRPRLCFFENVEGHISLGLRAVVNELGELGYRTTWGIFSAAEVGAPHQRKRVFILAHRDGERLEGLRECCATSGRETQVGYAGSSCDVWPSRPGEPQYSWEPPRVVVGRMANADSSKSRAGRGDDAEVSQVSPKERKDNSAFVPGGEGSNRGEEPSRVVANAECVRESQHCRGVGEVRGRVIDSGEGMGNAESGNGQRGASREARHTAQPNEGSINRQTQPALGLCSDESSSFLGETLTQKPYGDNVDEYESLSEKTRARQILFEVWNKVDSQKVQWTHGGLQCFLAQEILQSGMQLGAFTQRICYFVWCVQTSNEAKGWGLSGMWVYESCRNSSQRQEPIEQFKRELGYALCQLSYEIALERGQETVEREAILQGVREASERAWALSNALPEMEEIWRSTLDQKVWEKGCYIEASSQGNRTDELRLLGNGVVPATAERAFRTLLAELML